MRYFSTATISVISAVALTQAAYAADMAVKAPPEHRPVNIKGLRAIYERHTLNHHQFFTDDEMRFRDHKDWRVTVFPPYALVVFILMSIPPAVVLGTLLSPNVGWLFMASTTGMYLIYEFMHFCRHVDENAFVRHCPFVNTLRRRTTMPG